MTKTSSKRKITAQMVNAQLRHDRVNHAVQSTFSKSQFLHNCSSSVGAFLDIHHTMRTSMPRPLHVRQRLRTPRKPKPRSIDLFIPTLCSVTPPSPQQQKKEMNSVPSKRDRSGWGHRLKPSSARGCCQRVLPSGLCCEHQRTCK